MIIGNNLPEEVVEADTMTRFKRLLDRYRFRGILSKHRQMGLAQMEYLGQYG